MSRLRRIHGSRQSGSVEPKAHGGGQALRIDKQGEQLLQDIVGNEPDLTLQELAERYLLERGIEVGVPTLFRALERLGVTRKKKTIFATERESDSTRLLRWHFARLGLEKALEKLIFFDESGLNLSMTRAYGRAMSSARVLDTTPKNWGESITLIAGIRLGGLVAPMMMIGSLTGPAFIDYIERCVVPQLRVDDVVVLDNLGAHRMAAVQHAIEEAGASVIFLPPYSPDLNPIELAWSKVKAILRKLKPRALTHLVDATEQALRAITESDLANWFRHAGYAA